MPKVTSMPMGGGTWYNLGSGSVTLYDDYLKWDEGVIHSIATNINYTDIISVSAGDGGTFFGEAFLQINTAGRTYTIQSLGKVPGHVSLGAEIRKRVSAAKNKAKAKDQIGTSGADEIKKYKELWHQGVITRKEFETKKNQILGL